MSNHLKKANLALVLIFFISLCLPSIVYAAPENSVVHTLKAGMETDTSKSDRDAPLAASTFNKKAPTDGSTNLNPIQVKLEWTAISKIFQYRYCYYSYELTTNICNLNDKATWLSNGTATSVQLPELVPGKTYYWKVGAKLTDNSFVYANGSSSNKWSFRPDTVNNIYDDTNSKWKYSGTWATYTDTGPYNDTLHYTTTNGATASLTFTGARFQLTYTKYSNRGSFEVWLDDVTLLTTIDPYSATLEWKQTYLSPILTNGTHTVKIKHVSSGGRLVDVDAIQILPVMSTGLYDDTNGNWMYIGNWTASDGAGPYNTTLHYTMTVGDSAEMLFSGTRFALKYTQHSSRGSIDVYVDDFFVGTINENGATTYYQQVYFSPVYAADTHSVRFVYSGGAGAIVDIDAIQILGSPVGAGTYDDTNNNWVYSEAWTANTDSGPYNDTLHYTSTNGAAASFTFTGATFKLIYTMDPDRGSFEIWLDNTTLLTTINASSPTLQWQQSYTSALLTNGTHTVTVKNTSTSSDKKIDVDAIQIYNIVSPGIYDDTNNNWVYTGSWTAYTGTGPYSNTLHYTTTVGDSVELLFNGVRFVLTYTKYANRGTFEVWLDDITLVTTINAYSATTLYQQTYVSPSYPNGNHKVKIKYKEPVGRVVDIDAIRVYGLPDTTFPAAITTLVATPGTTNGSVNLRWNAVGDDDMTGTATSYLVRYSTSPID
ncbi:MAG TPA: hypothetical protein VHP14_00700, partial [Anaerolineales bacterium]|nr:hypothetical protein [Anaerolineales bacterium]